MSTKSSAVHPLSQLVPVQKALHAQVEAQVAHHLDAWRRQGEAQVKFLEEVQEAAPERLAQVWQSASQSYLQACQRQAQEFVKGQLGLFQKAQSELVQLAKAA